MRMAAIPVHSLSEVVVEESFHKGTKHALVDGRGVRLVRNIRVHLFWLDEVAKENRSV